MVRALQVYLDFCYIAQRDVHDTNSLKELEDALGQFHTHREIFQTSGVQPKGFNLLRSHAAVHYLQLIQAFGAPNGLCSSITESKHIKAVKEPWRRSSHWNALGQMLTTNARLDKLAAARADFTSRGMLEGSCLSAVLRDLGKLEFLLHFLQITYITGIYRPCTVGRGATSSGSSSNYGSQQ